MQSDVIAPVVVTEPALAPPAQRAGWGWLTIEHALFALILLAAGFLRFFSLAGQPLSPLEAANVWAAWLAATANAAPAVPPPASPLFHSVQTLFFWLAGGGDGLARAMSACLGVGLVALTWLFRPWLGRVAALLLALFMALDPWLTLFSRLADGAVFTLFFGLLTLAGLLRLLDPPVGNLNLRRWRRLTAISAGLLLVSGPLCWSFLVVIVLLIGFTPGAWTALRDQGIGSREDLMLLLAAALLGSTTWLAQPAGLGLISTSLSVWFSGLTSGPYSLNWWWLRLVVDQPLLLVFGLIGLARLWLQPAETAGSRLQSWRTFLTAWLVWGMLLGLLPGHNPLSLLLIGLPLLLATADMAAYLIAGLRSGVVWRESWLLVALVTVLLVAAAFWAAALVAQPAFDLTIFRGLILFLLLAGLTVVLYALWADWQQARLLMGGYGFVLLLLATVSSGWQLNQRVEPDLPDGFFAEFTDPDVRRLAEDVHKLSAQRTGDAGQIPVLVQMGGSEGARPDPVLGWYLRNLRNLRWVLAPEVETPGEESPLVITQGENADDAELAGYMGSRYTVRARWLPTLLLTSETTATPGEFGPLQRLSQAWGDWLRALLRWMIYREVNTLPPTEAVVLWVKGQE